MKLRHLLESNSIARTNALKQQQMLIDAGRKNIEVTKLPGGTYALSDDDDNNGAFFCTSDGRVEMHELDPKQVLIDGRQAYNYCSHILNKTPCPELAPLIAQIPSYSYFYAYEILKGPFPAGEPAIAKSPYYSSNYALEVLKAPFPAGEPAIATVAEHAYTYALRILKKPWPTGEQVIATSSYYAFQYARDVLKNNRFLDEN